MPVKLSLKIGDGSRSCLRGSRGDEFDQCSPWNQRAALVQNHLLAGFLRVEIEVQGSLFQAMFFMAKVMFFQHIFE